MATFVSESILPVAGSFDPAVMSSGEPSLPAAFRWKDTDLVVGAILRTWRGTKVDRGESYLKRHWFEIELRGGGTAVVYFERQARRGAPRWWLYTIAE